MGGHAGRATAPARAPGEARRTDHRVSSPARGGRLVLQARLKVSSPGDPAEREAETLAARIVSMPATAPTGGPAERAGDVIQRQAGASPAAAAAPSGGASGGTPLPPAVRRDMEPRFGADFGGVRIHTGAGAAAASEVIGARAFTVGPNIYFGAGAYRPESNAGRELIAHELTHTIQQSAAPQATIQRSALVRERAPVHAQRVIGAVLDKAAELANLIPGFRMFTLVIGVNPINGARVARTPANFLRAVLEFSPIGALLVRALDNYGIIDRAGAFVEEQIRGLGIVGSSIVNAVRAFLNDIDLLDLVRINSLWERGKRIVTEPINRIINLARNVGAGVLGIIKDAILRPLARLAEGTRGYDLLKAVLGRDPITGEPVPQNAETLVGGFMRLIGQGEVWENIKRANAIPRAWAWFQSALAELRGFVAEIPAQFMNILRGLQVNDILDLPAAFRNVARAFGDFVGRFISWAGAKVFDLLQIIFEVVAPNTVPYLRRAAAAFRTIIRDPIRFIGHLVRAGIQGLRQFASRFLTHLGRSLIQWLTGALPGVYIPTALNLMEIVKFVLSVLGVSWQNIRQKLVRAVGETTVRVLETTFDLVVTLVRDGPAAVWQRIVEGIQNLRQMVIDQIMSYVQQQVVQRAIEFLVSSLTPAGAFIQAIVAIYNTVMFFVERMGQIAEVAASVIDSISAIANGVIGQAADRVEQTMGRLLTMVIAFLARIARINDVAQRVMGIIQRVRTSVESALDRVVEWIRVRARPLLARVQGGANPAERLQNGLAAAQAAVDRFAGRRVGRAVLIPILAAIRTRYQLRTLEPVQRGDRWAVRGAASPEQERMTRAQVEGDAGRMAVGPGGAHGDQWNRGVAGVRQALAAVQARGESEAAIRNELPNWQRTYGFTALSLVADEQQLVINGSMSPTSIVATQPRVTQAALKTASNYDQLWFAWDEMGSVVDSRFTTAQNRRITSVRGHLEDIRPSGDTRTGNLRANRLAGYEDGDVAGHLIGHQFYGENYHRDNFAPMHPRTNHPQYYDEFERKMAEWMRARKQERKAFLVQVSVTAHYNDSLVGRARMRPLRFTFSATGITGRRSPTGAVTVTREPLARGGVSNPRP